MPRWEGVTHTIKQSKKTRPSGKVKKESWGLEKRTYGIASLIQAIRQGERIFAQIGNPD